MTKKSTIKNLLVVPLLASAIFLANPAFASNSIQTNRSENDEVRNITDKEDIENIPDPKKGIVGTVTGINKTIIIVTDENNTEYTVDATNATIMKEGTDSNINPNLVRITDVKIGDSIVVRGKINDKEIN